jgi:hypothetical protein
MGIFIVNSNKDLILFTYYFLYSFAHRGIMNNQ